MCPWQEDFYVYFLSHRHAILSRGTQRNRQKLSECSNPLEIILFLVVSAIRPSQTFSSDSRDLAISPSRTYLTLGRIYPTSRIYLDSIGFQRLGNLLRSNISDLSDLSEPHRVPVTCHSTLIRYIWAPSDISDPAESEPIWILHRTYPIEVGYIWCSDTSNGNKFMRAINRPPLPICFGWPLHQLKKLILFTFWAPPSHC
jgi:hypothetical protein